MPFLHTVITRIKPTLFTTWGAQLYLHATEDRVPLRSTHCSRGKRGLARHDAHARVGICKNSSQTVWQWVLWRGATRLYPNRVAPIHRVARHQRAAVQIGAQCKFVTAVPSYHRRHLCRQHGIHRTPSAGGTQPWEGSVKVLPLRIPSLAHRIAVGVEGWQDVKRSVAQHPRYTQIITIIRASLKTAANIPCQTNQHLLACHLIPVHVPR
mmetsp:Transcript_15909/g.28252  ORF Transcript_15909/g.28252 Transcript_15909/m.28252 type:complete len:210 (+) Transcript_15909:265-894(+)